MTTALFKASLVTRVEEAITYTIIDLGFGFGRFDLNINIPDSNGNILTFELTGEVDEDGEVDINSCLQYGEDSEGEEIECDLNISLRRIERIATETLSEEAIRAHDIEETEWWLGHSGRDSF